MWAHLTVVLKKRGGDREASFYGQFNLFHQNLILQVTWQIAPGVICDFSVERGKVDILSS